MTFHRSHALILSAALTLGHSALAADARKPGPPHVVTLETRDFRVEFAGDRAWTIHKIHFQGEMVADRVGFYGTVFAEEGGRWIGTGHNEGGIEQISSTTLTVDGKPSELADKAHYRGKRAEIRKRSMMGPIALEATYVVTDDAFLQRHRYEVTNDVTVGTLYAFMHAWLPRTTEWTAEKADGTKLEGTFDSQSGHKLREDVKWTAIHDPTTNRAMLAWYPKPLAGQGLKTFYWDKTVYHKLYNQIFSHSPVKKGQTFDAEVVIRGVVAPTPEWKKAAEALAEDTKSRVASGAISFE